MLVLGVLTYLLWILSADKELNFTAADFVPLIAVINSLGKGVQEFLESVLTVIVSGAQVRDTSYTDQAQIKHRSCTDHAQIKHRSCMHASLPDHIPLLSSMTSHGSPDLPPPPPTFSHLLPPSPTFSHLLPPTSPPPLRIRSTTSPGSSTSRQRRRRRQSERASRQASKASPRTPSSPHLPW